MIYLAASNKLTGAAKKWFDLGTGTMLKLWTGFKDAIIRRFKKKILFHVTLQRVKARKWNFVKEIFQYALEKLALIFSLNLSTEETIHLLISGISSRLLRRLLRRL